MISYRLYRADDEGPVNGLEWGMNIVAVLIVVALIAAKWSVLKMVRQINRRVEPSDQVSIKWWWPNYKDRRVMALYRSIFPQGCWRLVYIGSLGSAFILFLLAVFIGSHVGR